MKQSLSLHFVEVFLFFHSRSIDLCHELHLLLRELCRGAALLSIDGRPRTSVLVNLSGIITFISSATLPACFWHFGTCNTATVRLRGRRVTDQCATTLVCIAKGMKSMILFMKHIIVDRVRFHMPREMILRSWCNSATVVRVCRPLWGSPDLLDSRIVNDIFCVVTNHRLNRKLVLWDDWCRIDLRQGNFGYVYLLCRRSVAVLSERIHLSCG
mmetsp:Transcript_8378/g.19290  ORF Transcript_8378/g.19290 Transcript_8378/m.19290 type:complete len:213 (-) Transcript_8378:14-652(-)